EGSERLFELTRDRRLLLLRGLSVGPRERTSGVAGRRDVLVDAAVDEAHGDVLDEHVGEPGSREKRLDPTIVCPREHARRSGLVRGHEASGGEDPAADRDT